MKWLHTLLIAGTSCIFFACANSDQSANDGGTGITSNVQQLSYSVAATYPHDTSSFTQGLEFYNGKLLESTGNLGKSKLMQVDMATGNAVTSKPLSAELFGEGLTVLNDTLYQLTWQNRKVLVYDAKNLQPIKELPLNTDGWGIANDGQHLIVTDGSSNLYFYEPGTFRLLRTQGVTMDETPIGNLNELEFINGFLYANIWQSPYIVKIDPSSGQVLARLDFSDLVQRVKTKIPQYDTGNEATLNGIAYDSTTRKIYITGKYWPELYEVQFEH